MPKGISPGDLETVGDGRGMLHRRRRRDPARSSKRARTPLYRHPASPRPQICQQMHRHAAGLLTQDWPAQNAHCHRPSRRLLTIGCSRWPRSARCCRRGSRSCTALATAVSSSTWGSRKPFGSKDETSNGGSWVNAPTRHNHG